MNSENEIAWQLGGQGTGPSCLGNLGSESGSVFGLPNLAGVFLVFITDPLVLAKRQKKGLWVSFHSFCRQAKEFWQKVGNLTGDWRNGETRGQCVSFTEETEFPFFFKSLCYVVAPCVQNCKFIHNSAKATVCARVVLMFAWSAVSYIWATWRQDGEERRDIRGQAARPAGASHVITWFIPGTHPHNTNTLSDVANIHNWGNVNAEQQSNSRATAKQQQSNSKATATQVQWSPLNSNLLL